MKIRAKVSFCGAITMGLGETRECTNKALIDDLIKAGYVEEVVEPKPDKAEKPKKKAKANEDQ